MILNAVPVHREERHGTLEAQIEGTKFRLGIQGSFWRAEKSLKAK